MSEVCQSRQRVAIEQTSLRVTMHRFLDWEEAQEYHHSQGMRDSLPVVSPTEANVQAMLDYAWLSGTVRVAT